MATTGVRWFHPIDEPDIALRRLMYRARRRRLLLDLARTATARLEVRWAVAARELRDAIDTHRAGR